MMTNVPKPELERGAYIVYTDEPGEILSPGSTGGGGGGEGGEGGGAAFEEYQIAVHLYCGAESSFEDIEPFKDDCILYNGEPLTGFTMNTDVGAFEKILNVKALDVITGLPHNVPGLGTVVLSDDDEYYEWCLAFVRVKMGKSAVIIPPVNWVDSFSLETDIPCVSFIVDKAVL